jgi:FkbM family methyltransferase
MRSKVIVDIGGHIGSHSILYSKLNQDCIIHTFEPQKRIYDLLVENVKLNSCKNIITYNNAVGNMNQICNLSKKIYDGYNCDVEYGSNRMINLGGMQLGLDGENVNMLTVDTLNLICCDFMKIDVEGAEHLVIYGARDTIKKYRPVVFFECTSKRLDESTITKLDGSLITSTIEQLCELQYKIYDVDDCNKIAIP